MKDRVASNQKYYLKTKAKRQVTKCTRRRDDRQNTYEKLFEYCKDHPCVKCGEQDYVVLEFDHIDPTTKVSAISRMVATGKTWQAISEELKKCRVLCANCHRRHTAKQQKWYKGTSLEVS